MLKAESNTMNSDKISMLLLFAVLTLRFQ